MGASWAVVGVVEWGFAWGKLHFVKINVLSQDKASRGVLGLSWADLGRQRGSKRRPFGGQVGVKKAKEK